MKIVDLGLYETGIPSKEKAINYEVTWSFLTMILDKIVVYTDPEAVPKLKLPLNDTNSEK